MKKIIIILVAALAAFTACNNANKQNNLVVAPDTASVRYQCPMKCQGDTAYTTEGQCPVCEMDLEKVETPHHQE